MFIRGVCGGKAWPLYWNGLRQACLLLVALILAAGLFAPAAEANPKFAAITIDARNGKVLFAEDPDSLRHPASLTKMMTLYVLFQELQKGRLKLDSPIRISARATSMAPSKLGAKAGSTITVEMAIRALVVKSANDVAAAVAENVAGSESAFADRMTRTARSLGMTRTVFANASGLPNPRQVTTARDMATLGLRLMRDFPQYYPYFRTRSFVYNGRTIKGHNKLLGTYEGTDGIKTGYINASGFNLVTSARRGDKRLVGVVLGGRTGASRDAYMKTMLTRQFPKARNGKTIAALAGSSKGAVATAERQQVAAVETDVEGTEQPAAPDKQKARKEAAAKRLKWSKAGETVGPAPAEPVEQGDTEDGMANLAAQAAQGGTDPDEEDGVETVPAPSAGEAPFAVKTPEQQLADKAAVASLAPAPDAGWTLNLGDYATKNDAQAVVQNARKRAPDLFKDKTAQTVKLEKSGKVTYRARFSGFDQPTAAAVCKTLKKQKMPCSPQGPT